MAITKNIYTSDEIIAEYAQRGVVAHTCGHDMELNPNSRIDTGRKAVLLLCPICYELVAARVMRSLFDGSTTVIRHGG